MYAFEYRQAKSVAEAQSLLASTGGLTTSINMGFKRTSFGPTALGFKFWRHQVLL